MKNFGNGASADGAATFTDGELGSLFHGDGVDEVDGEGDVVTRHNHIGAGREFDASGDVGRTEEELRTIAVKEVGVTATFLFGEDVGRRGELVVPFLVVSTPKKSQWKKERNDYGRSITQRRRRFPLPYS